jgi:hypothetical protein
VKYEWSYKLPKKFMLGLGGTENLAEEEKKYNEK